MISETRFHIEGRFMQTQRLSMAMLGMAVLGIMAPQGASADIVGKAPPCTIDSISGNFTNTSATYAAKGTCRSSGSLGSTITFPWRVTGLYPSANSTAKEDIVVDAPSISEPSHPYGKWSATYYCPGDPWLTQFYAPSTGKITCHIVSRYADTPVFKDNSLEEYFDNSFNYQPLTAIDLTPQQRNALLAKKDSDLKALAKTEEEQRRGAAVRQATPHQIVVGELFPPTILAPTPGQQFYVRLPVPIRLAPSQGAVAAGYVISLEMRDVNNNWIPAYPNIGVDAAQAQSAAGFTQFGPDGGQNKVGAYPSRVGTWRVSAQVSVPKPSRWSQPVLFTILQPRVSAPAGIK